MKLENALHQIAMAAEKAGLHLGIPHYDGPSIVREVSLLYDAGQCITSQGKSPEPVNVAYDDPRSRIYISSGISISLVPAFVGSDPNTRRTYSVTAEKVPEGIPPQCEEKIKTFYAELREQGFLLDVHNEPRPKANIRILKK